MAGKPSTRSANFSSVAPSSPPSDLSGPKERREEEEDEEVDCLSLSPVKGVRVPTGGDTESLNSLEVYSDVGTLANSFYPTPPISDANTFIRGRLNLK